MAPGTEATVFIVDDDGPFRESLELLLQSVGLQTTSYICANHFFESCPPEASGCLMLDLRLPDASGLRVQRMLRQRGFSLPVILMSGYADVPTAVTAMRRGAVDFLVKPLDDQRALDAVQRALDQEAQERSRRWRVRRIEKRYERLTPREREVMGLVVGGKLNKQVAAELGISVKTVEDHRAQVMQKMRAADLPALVRMAVQGDLTT